MSAQKRFVIDSEKGKFNDVSGLIAKAIAGSGKEEIRGDGAGVLSVATLLTSIIFMLILETLCKKFKLKWFEPFAMPLSMICGMCVAVLLAEALPPDIAFLEWRG